MRTLQSIFAATVLTLAAAGVSAQETHNYQVAIADPADQSTVFSNSGDMTAQVTMTPALANGDRLQLLVDGLPTAPPSSALEFNVSGLVRGLHHVQARIIDSTGNVGSISPPSQFYVWHASRLYPGRHAQ